MPIVVGALAAAAIPIVLFIAGVIPGLKDDKKSQPAVVAATVPATAPAKVPSIPSSGTPAKATPNPVWAKITPEDLLAAALTRTDVEQLANKPGDQWWPGVPRFAGPPLIVPDYEGQRIDVTQEFERVGGPEWIWISVTLFPDNATATDCFTSLLSTVNKGDTVLAGPAVGDEQRYFTWTDSGDDAPNSSSIRFRVGPLIAQVTWGDKSSFQTPSTMARYATALLPKVNSLLGGQLAVAPIRPELTSLLPPAVSVLGPVLGTAALPPEVWRHRDSSGKLAQSAEYSQGVLSQLALRRYSLVSDPTQVVEVMLFPFKDAASAQAYMTNQIGAAAGNTQRKLDPGKVGQVGVYVLTKDDTYRLQFAVGAFATDIECFSPYDDVSSVCETAARQVGEVWYPRLSTAAPLTR
jgi:hypothetical protein